MNELWILDEDGEPQSVQDVHVWARWFNTANRRVAETTIGRRLVSTVFLGIDHSFGEGPPLLFETMVFGAPSYNDQVCERYSTKADALAGHAQICKQTRGVR